MVTLARCTITMTIGVEPRAYQEGSFSGVVAADASEECEQHVHGSRHVEAARVDIANRDMRRIDGSKHSRDLIARGEHIVRSTNFPARWAGAPMLTWWKDRAERTRLPAEVH
jgi:hypothetical protein